MHSQCRKSVDGCVGLDTPLTPFLCEDRVLDGPASPVLDETASVKKGSKGGDYKYCTSQSSRPAGYQQSGMVRS